MRYCRKVFYLGGDTVHLSTSYLEHVSVRTRCSLQGHFQKQPFSGNFLPPLFAKPSRVPRVLQSRTTRDLFTGLSVGANCRALLAEANRGNHIGAGGMVPAGIKQGHIRYLLGLLLSTHSAATSKGATPSILLYTRQVLYAIPFVGGGGEACGGGCLWWNTEEM